MPPVNAISRRAIRGPSQVNGRVLHDSFIPGGEISQRTFTVGQLPGGSQEILEIQLSTTNLCAARGRLAQW